MANNQFKAVYDQLPFEPLKRSLVIAARKGFSSKVEITLRDIHSGSLVDNDEFSEEDLRNTMFASILSSAQICLVKDLSMALITNTCLRNEIEAECSISLGGILKAEMVLRRTPKATINWNGMVIDVTFSEIKDIK